MVNESIRYYTIKHEMLKEMISILSAQTSNWLDNYEFECLEQQCH